MLRLRVAVRACWGGSWRATAAPPRGARPAGRAAFTTVGGSRLVVGRLPLPWRLGFGSGTRCALRSLGENPPIQTVSAAARARGSAATLPGPLYGRNARAPETRKRIAWADARGQVDSGLLVNSPETSPSVQALSAGQPLERLIENDHQ